MMRVTFAAVLLAFLALPSLAQDLIKVTTSDINSLDADGHLDFHFTVTNIAPGALSDVNVRMAFSPGVVFVSAPGADCAQAADGMRCTLPPMPFRAVTVFDVS